MMNANYFIHATAFSVVWLCLGLTSARADIQARLSVKFIHNNDAGSTRPGGAIGTNAGFNQEVAYGNLVQAIADRGFSLAVVEFIEIQPPAPAAASTNLTCATTNNNATLTCNNTNGLQNYMRVQGAGIPANTVVLSISGNSFTMSANATANGPSVPVAANFPADHWFNLPARLTRQYIENTALAAQAVWAWNPNAINVYVNNSSSGQCSFVGTGGTISLGSTVGTGTVLHETGHIFDLKHTHALDYTTNTNPANGVFAASDLMDGDGLNETANDNPNITTNDQLCVAIFGIPYNPPAMPPGAPFANAAQRAVVDSSFQNVMSYHTEAVLLTVQMDLWTLNANNARFGFCTGHTWFLANGGNNSAAGNAASVPLATVASGLAHVSNGNDVVLLRNGSYSAPAGGVFSTPCTLRATRGDATVHFP